MRQDRELAAREPRRATLLELAPAANCERQPSRVAGGFVCPSADYWLYVPAQYRAEAPTALMVFQDGHAYVSEEGAFRVPVVFDNLIHQDSMPVTIGLFINPGHAGKAPPETPWQSDARSYEYDSMTENTRASSSSR